MNGLGILCSNHRLFLTLSEQRERNRDAHRGNLDTLARMVSDRANARGRAGASFEEAFGEFSNFDGLREEPLPPDNPALIAALRTILDSGEVWCGKVRDAVRAGGANRMDAALSPGGEGRSVGIKSEVSRVSLLFAGLRIGIADPRFLIANRCEEMRKAGEFFGSASNDLRSVMDRPAAPLARPDDQRVGLGTAQLPRTVVVLWQGAEHSDRNVRLARTMTAYLEAFGNVAEALKALEVSGYPIRKSAFYDHLAALDEESPGWRDKQLVSGQPGNPENLGIVGRHGKRRGK